MLPGIYKKVLVSFIFFCIVIVKDILISDLELIPIRSPINRMISWFVILPIFFIGLLFSIQYFYQTFVRSRKSTDDKKYLNTFLALPMVLYLIYIILILFSQFCKMTIFLICSINRNLSHTYCCLPNLIKSTQVAKIL